MTETMTGDALAEARSLMRGCSMESAVGYATALAHASGKTTYEVLHSDAYRAFGDAWKAMYLAMIIRDPDYNGAHDRACGEAGHAARRALFVAIMGRDPVIQD